MGCTGQWLHTTITDEEVCSGNWHFWVPDFWDGRLTPAHWEYRTWEGSIDRFYVSGLLCPPHSEDNGGNTCNCKTGYAPAPDNLSCRLVTEIAQTTPPLSCQAAGSPNPGVGKPIYPATGTEHYTLDTGLSVGGQPLTLTYDTLRRAALLNTGSGAKGTDLPSTEAPSFGELWLSSVHKQLIIGPQGKTARVSRGDGRIVSFTGNGTGTFTPSADLNDRLLSVPGGYRYIDAAAQAQETYNAQGQLTRIDSANGSSLTFTYSDTTTSFYTAPGAGYLLTVTDPFGRTLQFRYNGDGLVKQVSDPTGQTVSPSYNNDRTLARLTWSDTTYRQFLYENSIFGWALTGILDENLARYATIGYDSAGRATSTQLAGGVNAYSVTYTQPPAVVVSDAYDPATQLIVRTRSWQVPTAPVVTRPDGQTATLGITSTQGQPRLTSSSQPAGSGCAASTSTQTYDANANITSHVDFNGHKSCHSYDIGRNLETTRVEGLASTAACDGTVPTGSRKVSTQWHPVWRLPSFVAEPLKLTAYVFNGQPDPFNGNAVASCASAAQLPDGTPIAVLCKKIELPTTDADGHLGFSATPQSGIPARQWQWAYNAFGQVLTETDPLNHTTTSTYHSDTTADHTLGDLQTAKNARNQLTQFTKYNAAGQPQQSIDTNGITTDFTYDTRLRLLTAATAGETTSYTWDPTGLLKQVTLPDNSFVTYTYDAAHRLTGVADNLGNAITYTLDNSGNRKAEQVKDPGSTLKRQLTRVMDALNRVQQLTGRQ